MPDVLAQLKKRIEGDQEQDEFIQTYEAKTVKITAGELREVCKKYPDHYIVKTAYNKATKGFPDDAKMYVEALDLQAVLEGKKVNRYKGEDSTYRKELVDPKTSTPQPTTKK